MTFDPKNHKFGMAYRQHNGNVGIILDYSHSMGFLMKAPEGGIHWTVPRKKKLTRAPEHDLVPRSSVDKLIKALEMPNKMVDADMMFGLSDFDNLPYETVQAIARAAVRIVGQRNQEALSEFNSQE